MLAALVLLALMGAGRAAELAGLTVYGTGAAVDPVGWRGRILVLDFFAPWCVPCLGASRELQSGIQAHYAAAGGNPRGIAVEVLPVNIDTGSPPATARFVRQAGLTRVYEDAGGRLFAAYGGTGVPFVVVLDATGEAPGNSFPVVAAFAGHPGLEPLRGVIDRIGGAPSADPPLAATRGWGWLVAPRTSALLELSGEALLHHDVNLYQAGFSWFERRPDWDYRVQISENLHDAHYEPAPSDFISRETDLWAEQFTAQGRVRARPADRWQLEVSGGFYEGFSDFRSLWLDHYYRQYFGRIPGYTEADPSGFNLAPGVRWEAVPGNAFLQAALIYQHDRVSPAYELAPFQPLVRGRPRLDTIAGSVTLEHLLARSLRVLHEARVTDTTDRDLRYNYELSLNWSPVPSVVLRGTGGLTLEPPEFHAYYGQVSLEHDWQGRWFVGAFGRCYTDDGLVRDPELTTTAAPPLQTLRAGLSVRYQSERLGWKLAVGPYLTRQEEVAPISRDFSMLYADRDWLFLEMAASVRF